ncbi:MAG: 7-carboxy-7-deazaguanine synthase QueE [bacterium]
MKYNISEIFHSIQGEGPHIGHPVIFLRLSGCNLRCKWGETLCDTPYTSWNPEQNLLLTEEILTQLEITAPTCKHIVITGGEPTIQPDFKELCVALKANGYNLDLETNGTGLIPDEIDTIVCSPKLSDSIPTGTSFAEIHEKRRTKLHPTIQGNDTRLNLKFVISPRTDIQEVKNILQQLNSPAERTYLMPEGITSEVIRKNSPVVAEMALKNGFNFSTRLHILLWGNKRGV